MSVLMEMETPVFAAEGVPENTDPSGWKISIGGMAEKEMEIPLDDIKALPVSQVDCRLTSVSGWSVRAKWDGVLWRDFIKAYPPSSEATHVTFTSHGGYTTTVPLDDLDHPRVLWAWGVDGEPLEDMYGGPLRMIIPNLWGYKSCKWIVKVTYADCLEPGYWECRGYSNEGHIKPARVLDVNSKERVNISGGEVTEF
jgi:DMSO/TMAO reductase YedYZ molybdopterin-dependent catalytic subunit